MKYLPTRLKTAVKILLGRIDFEKARPPITAITPEEVEEARSFFPMDKFFVYGHARSGTTMLMYLLDTHPEVRCSRQAHFFSRAPFLSGLVSDPDVAAWLTRGSMRWNQGRDLSPVVMRAAADYILERDARRAGASIVGDKSPNSINDGEAVTLTHHIYPDARIIFIVRDGRDAVLSHRFQAFIDATQHLSKSDWQIREDFALNPESYRAAEKSLFTEKLLQDYARGWVRNLESTSAQGLALYKQNFYQIRYEDLLAEPLAEMKKAWAFLGADPDAPGLEAAIDKVINYNRDAAWQEKKAGDFTSAIPKGQVGGWKTFFTARDQVIFESIAGDTLRKWQY